MKEKTCGSCHYFKNEDTNGFGWCEYRNIKSSCSSLHCPAYKLLNNGWKEITPDIVDELYTKQPIVVAWKYDDIEHYKLASDHFMSLSTTAKAGGYYYYELPRLEL